MAFKYVSFAVLAFAVLADLSAAGGPASYSISAPSIDYGSVGSSNEHTVKGLYGQNVASHYSKAVDSAHSSVRVASSRYTNDALGYAPHYAAAPAIAHHGYAAPAIAHHGYAAPAVSYAHGYGAAYAAPAVKVATPVLAHHGYAAPVVAHHGYGAPALAHHGYGAGYAHAALAAPALSYGHGYSHGYGAAYAAPAIKVASPVLAHHGYASPVVAHHGYGAHGYAAPLAYKTPVAVAHGPAVVHSTFSGLGANYAW